MITSTEFFIYTLIKLIDTNKLLGTKYLNNQRKYKKAAQKN